MMKQAAVIRQPRGKALPVLVNIPHAGTVVPTDIAENFADFQMGDLPTTDWHLDKLFDFLPDLGITTIFSTHSRLVVDLDHTPDEKVVIDNQWNSPIVPCQTPRGEHVWKTPPDYRERKRRIEKYYHPYHRMLDGIVADMLNHFGRLYLVDAHSINAHVWRDVREVHHDIYLGNQNGETCAQELVNLWALLFSYQGYHTAAAGNLDGGYIAGKYGEHPNIESLQLELRQRLYMDEQNPDEPLDNHRFKRTKRDLQEIFEMFVLEMEDKGLFSPVARPLRKSARSQGR